MSVLVVENPSAYGESAPYDSFVLITIDIASSLRGVTDKLAIQAAEALPRVRCLAWINSSTLRLGSPLSFFVFMLADRSLPAAPRTFAAVPIAPAPPHPDTGRAAAQLSRPLPWPDCHLHTLRDFTAPISRLYQGPEGPGFALLDRSQREHVLIAEMEDVDATQDERYAELIAAGYGVRRSRVRIVQDGHDAYAIIEDDSASGSQASSRRAVSDCSASEDGERASAAASGGDGPTLPRPSVRVDAAEFPSDVEHEHYDEGEGIELHVEASCILDPSAEFGSIEDFLSVVGRLNDIEAGRRERALTARLARAAVSKTAAWLQGVGASSELEYVSRGNAGSTLVGV